MTIQDELYEKVSTEHNAQIEEIKKLPLDEILGKAHEIAIKADLLMCFEAGEFEGREARILFALDRPLDYIYQRWLDMDSSHHMDSLRECIDDFVKATIKGRPAQEKEFFEGYELVGRLTVGENVIVLGHNPDATMPYATWKGAKEEKGNYSQGHFYHLYKDAREDLYERASAEYREFDRSKPEQSKDRKGDSYSGAPKAKPSLMERLEEGKRKSAQQVPADLQKNNNREV